MDLCFNRTYLKKKKKIEKFLYFEYKTLEEEEVVAVGTLSAATSEF